MTSGDPSCIDTGDSTWVMLSTILVLGMMPGLAFFEAGLLRTKNSLTIITQILPGIALMGVMWHIFGFTLVFGDDVGGFIGNFQYVFWRNLDMTCISHAPKIPGLTYALFQMMFAAITPLLISGAVAERMKYRAFVYFIILYEIFVYYPLAHWIWGGGWADKMGVLDFAGGIVIHASSGVSALVLAKMLGPRKDVELQHEGEFPPHNVPLAAVGTVLLWMGWYGFNAGSALTSGNLAANTMGTTTVATCTSLITWMVISAVRHRRAVDTVAIFNGALAGLAGITPASGYIDCAWASLVGIILAIGSYFSIVLFKGKMKIDDALDVSSVHGTTGVIGSLLIGVFARDVGLIYSGSGKQLALQLMGVVVAVAWSAFWTFIFGLILMKLPNVGLRVKPEVEEMGMDHRDHMRWAYHKLEDQDYPALAEHAGMSHGDEDEKIHPEFQKRYSLHHPTSGDYHPVPTTGSVQEPEEKEKV
eukprot:TRINITY_DN2236_c0_g1_i3.p1 TRINITY_DN2236_c0_g1~~TRINITY_DN2236_c0_g1_i3.p1  ORF type:complete len:484 (-),score=42.74 TRINITY_DN2236_c0_g1_i3:107-1528(-)